MCQGLKKHAFSIEAISNSKWGSLEIKNSDFLKRCVQTSFPSSLSQSLSSPRASQCEDILSCAASAVEILSHRPDKKHHPPLLGMRLVFLTLHCTALHCATSPQNSAKIQVSGENRALECMSDKCWVVLSSSSLLSSPASWSPESNYGALSAECLLASEPPRTGRWAATTVALCLKSPEECLSRAKKKDFLPLRTVSADWYSSTI